MMFMSRSPAPDVGNPHSSSASPRVAAPSCSPVQSRPTSSVFVPASLRATSLPKSIGARARSIATSRRRSEAAGCRSTSLMYRPALWGISDGNLVPPSFGKCRHLMLLRSSRAPPAQHPQRRLRRARGRGNPRGHAGGRGLDRVRLPFGTGRTVSGAGGDGCCAAGRHGRDPVQPRPHHHRGRGRSRRGASAPGAELMGTGRPGPDRSALDPALEDLPDAHAVRPRP